MLLLAEDKWASAHQDDVRQYVLLGAGLDTYTYRHPANGCRIFEFDLVVARQLKQDARRVAGIEVPHTVRYVSSWRCDPALARY